MMRLEVVRVKSTECGTTGCLYDCTNGRRWLAWTLEDSFRFDKVDANTRIPTGTYRLSLRTTGGFHAKYRQRFRSMHKGMLWVRDVPKFRWVLIHCGNTSDDTAGCLLIGNTLWRSGIAQSVQSYRTVYPRIANHLAEGGEATIRYSDIDWSPEATVCGN